jgi:uncharacterized phage infection (PIP) family protein YhgE
MASLKARIGNGSDPSETQAANETETKPLAPNAIISVPQGGSAAETPSAKAPRTKAPEDGSASSLVLFAVTLAIFWLGAAIAFLWGYYGVPGLVALPPHLIAFAGAATLIPPLFFITCAYAFGKAQTMSNAALALRASAEKLSTVDETVVEKAQNLGRAVRRELDTLNIGLDAAYGRLRTLESVLEDRIAQLDDANARAEVKTQAVAQRLNDERETIESIAELLDQVAARASETLAGRAAQLKTLVEQAGGELKSAGQLLDTQATQFREASDKAAEAPAAAAIELDRQSKKIEAAAEKATSRAEFVLGRQERQRTAMNELVVRLREESTRFEEMLETQKDAMEHAAELLAGEAKRFEELSARSMQKADTVLEGLNERSAQMAESLNVGSESINAACDGASKAMSALIDTLREASTNANELMDKTTSEAKRRATGFVGDAMESSDQLLRAASSVAEQAEKARAILTKAVEDAERHMVAIPGVAAQEAERIRDTMRQESEKMLDLSARTLATIHSRTSTRRAHVENSPEETPQEAIGEGLRGLAKRITAPRKRSDDKGKSRFELSEVLAAAESQDNNPTLRPDAISALGSIQSALAELASDLEIAMDESVSPELWRHYLDGDRGVFARKFATSIGPDTVEKIAGLYRDDPHFHSAAEAYLEEFEALLAQALEGDRDGFLASTLLGADTGKIYLVVAYALGRLD